MAPPLAGPWKFFRRLYMKRCIFCHFPARIAKFNNVWWFFAFPNFRKMGEFAVSIEHSEAKSVSASGGLCPPDPPTRDSAPGPRWGLCLQTPVIGLRSACLPCPPLCQILNTPLFKNHIKSLTCVFLCSLLKPSCQWNKFLSCRKATELFVLHHEVWGFLWELC